MPLRRANPPLAPPKNPSPGGGSRVVARGDSHAPRLRWQLSTTSSGGQGRQVGGVVDVGDELSVDLRDRTEDDGLRGLALQALMSNGRVPADRIEASVANGWLTLEGEVKHQSQSDAAFDAVRRLPGIGGITNKIVAITAGLDG